MFFLMSFLPNSKSGAVTHRWLSFPGVNDAIQNHFPAAIGLPLAALLSLWIVSLFGGNYGPIELSILGFKFRGASGPIIMWGFCFLAITLAIKMLW
jgi:hypothetical protein